ncbi:alanine dehydrogenase [Tessaracoccus caeni]|uniref:alanine dehydrogenase n=1 Tax=Tessaracoccus caeni TaxID=3031239 RepID=UPI0023DB0CC9|nr:alanine dehydrogenase [Tessaracoccus caeni]MDF1487290.1 alanine dehydrogenase [Tessaracoccus caeni]
MRIGVPREVKNNEFRVGLTPAGVLELAKRGHLVSVETGAGVGAGISDQNYRDAGASIIGDSDRVWADADLVVKVKEPVAGEYRHLRQDLVLFTYLHLAANRPLVDALLGSGTTSIAYETVQLADGSLPLLAPMSEIAGALAPQVGAQSMMKPAGGPGLLLGGIAGVPNAKVVILGGGVAGQDAARVAAGMGADVTLLDTDIAKLRLVEARHGGLVRTLASSTMTVREQVLGADLVIGTVLIPGARAPKLVTDEMVQNMVPGSVLVDVSIDQGGCFESSHPTTHADPTFPVHGSTFYCVSNIPGAVPKTSTAALTNATLRYVLALADHGWRDAARIDPALARGISTRAGQLTSQPVAEAFGLPYSAIDWSR